MRFSGRTVTWVLYIYQLFFTASDQELNCHFVDRLRLLDALHVPCFAMTGVELWDGKGGIECVQSVFVLYCFFCLQMKLLFNNLQKFNMIIIATLQVKFFS